MKRKIENICRRWGIVEYSIFGSFSRNELRKDSDVDILVSFDKNRSITLFDFLHLKYELELLYGRKVDLVTRRGIENSKNYIRRNSILAEAKLVYAA